MKFPLTETLAREANRFQLRSACGDCFYYLAAEDACAHGWPVSEQKHGVEDVVARAADARAAGPSEATFCKEFELA